MIFELAAMAASHGMLRSVIEPPEDHLMLCANERVSLVGCSGDATLYKRKPLKNQKSARDFKSTLPVQEAEEETVAEEVSPACKDLAVGRSVDSISGEEFALGIERAASTFKDDYETTEEYKIRSLQSLNSYFQNKKYIVVRKHITSNLSFDYDADNKVLIYEKQNDLRCIEARERLCIGIHSFSKDALSTLYSYDLSFTPPKPGFSPFPEIPASPEMARSIREGGISNTRSIELLIVLKHETPFFINQSLSRINGKNRWKYHKWNIIPVKVMCTFWNMR